MKKTLAVAGIGAALLAGPLTGAGTASADTGAAASGNSNDPNADASFYRLLTTGPGALTVWNFPLLRAQGLQACAHITGGERSVDAVYDLQAAGYSFDDGNNIVSSAKVVYCPWNLSPAARAVPPPPPPIVTLPPNYRDGDQDLRASHATRE